MKKSVRKQEIAAFLLALTVAALVNFLFIGDNYYVTIAWDEAGYIGNAAALTGRDWSAFFCGAGTPYYAYGYSVFIALGMKLAEIFSRPELTFLIPKMASALGMTLTMPMAYYVGRRMFPEIHHLMIVFASVIAACYPPYVYYIAKLWPESFLYFLFWLLTFLLCAIEKNNKGRFVLVFAFGGIAAYIYWVHNRGIGVSLAAVIIIVLLFLRKKIRFTHLMLFAAAFIGTNIGGYLLNIWIKNSLFSLPVQNSNPMTNDIGGFSFLFSELMKPNPFVWDNLWRNTAGALFYLNASTLLLVSVFFFMSFLAIKRFLSRKGKIATDSAAPAGDAIWFFVFFAFLLSLGVGSFSICNNALPRYRFYGRYSEFCVGPILVLSILSLAQNSHRKIRLALVSVFALGSNALFFLANITDAKDVNAIGTLVASGYIWVFRALEIVKSLFSSSFRIDNDGIWILLMISVLSFLFVLLPFLLPPKIRRVFLCILLILSLTGAVYSGTRQEITISESEKTELCRRVGIENPTYFWMRDAGQDTNRNYYQEIFAATYCLSVAQRDIHVLYGEEIIEEYKKMPIGSRVVSFAGNTNLLASAFENGGLQCVYTGEKYTIWDKVDDTPAILLPGGLSGSSVLSGSDLSDSWIRGFYGTEISENQSFSWTEKESTVVFFSSTGLDRVNIWLEPQLVGMMDQIGALSGFDVYLDGVHIASVSSDMMLAEDPIVVEFPSPIAGKSCEIQLVCKGFVPKELGLSEDVRTLGLPVVRISVSTDNN